MPVTRRTQAFGAHPHTRSRIGTEHRFHRPLAVGAPIARARRSPSCPDLGVRVAEGVAMTGGMNDRLRQGGFDQGRGGRGPAAVMGADQHIRPRDGIAMAQTQRGLARRLDVTQQEQGSARVGDAQHA